MVQPFDPYAGYRALQGLQMGGEQIQQARLGNELAQLQIGLRSQLAGGAGAAPGAANAAPIAMPPIPGAAPSQPPPQGGAPAAWGHPVSQFGARMSPYGVPLPGGLLVSAAMSQDPAKAIDSAVGMRSQVLSQLASSATNADEWNQNVLRAYRDGWIDDETANQLYGHYEKQPAVVRSFAPAASQLSETTTLSGQGMTTDANGNPVPSPAAAGGAALKAASVADAQLPARVAEAQATAAARAQYRTVQVPYTDANGRTYDLTVPASSLPNLAGGAPPGAARTGADLASGTALPAQAFAARLTQAESGGVPTATSPTSSATGAAQFLDPTWLQTIRQARPDLAQGKTDQQLLAMRSDPALSAELAIDYARQNAGTLQVAGVQPTSLTLGLAHRFGPQGAVAVLKAAPDAPIAPLVGPQVMAANPDLRGQTVGSVLGAAFQRYGSAPVDLSATPAPPSAAAPSGGAGATLAVPGAIGGREVTTPTSQVTGTAIDQDGKEASEYQTGIDNATAAKVQLGEIRQLSSQVSTGAFGETRAKIANVLASLPGLAGDAGKTIADHILGMDPTKVQPMAKYMLQAVGTAEKDTNPRGGYQIMKVYQDAFPGLDTQPDSIRQMTNLLSVMQQREIDLGQGATNFYNDQFEGYRKGAGYQRLSSFESAFNKTNPPEVYAGAAAILNGQPESAWGAALKTPAEREQAVRIAMRTDPARFVPVQPPAPAPAGAPAAPAQAAPAAPAPGGWQPGVAYPPTDWRHFVQPGTQ